MVFGFNDDVTVFSHGLILLHHDVMWFIIIILTIVLGTLYKIIRQNNWIKFNKNKYYNTNKETLVFWEIALKYIKNVLYLGLAWKLVMAFPKRILKMRLHIPARAIGHYFIKRKEQPFSTKVCFFITGEESLLEAQYIPWVNFYGWYLGILERSVDIFEEFLQIFIKEKWSGDFFITVYQTYQLEMAILSYSTLSEFFYDDKPYFLNVNNFRHNTFLEYVWAIFPSVIIVLILIPSLFLLYSLDDDLYPEFTIKIVGNQWFWTYEYSDWLEKDLRVDLKFDSFLLSDINDLPKGSKRLLEVDKRLIVPINTTLRFLTTSSDVIHAWAVPELGVKVDAVPGRLNQFLVLICRPGVFYGQCSELCGVAHGFMPIVVKAVPFDVYKDWLF